MFLSRLQFALAAAVVVAMGAGLAWQVNENAQLRAEATRQSQTARTSRSALEKQVAAETERVATAEAKVAALLTAAKAAAPARSPEPASVGGATNTDDAAKAAIARAKRLVDAGKLQAALDEYVTSYRELQAIRPGSGECQSLMSAIKYLGRTYPPALTALGGLRDAAMAQWQAQPGRRELPFEIALLNERLGEGSRTLAVYDALGPNDSGRQGLAMVANGSFIEARRYADALIGKPFGRMLGTIEAGSTHLASQDAARQIMMRKSIVEQTVTNIEVLTGAGKTEEARILTEKLVAFDSTEPTRRLLQQHLDRALAPKQ